MVIMEGELLVLGGGGFAAVGTLTSSHAMPLSSHTTAGADQRGTLSMSQPRGQQGACEPVPVDALDATSREPERLA
jgi:hypothetical protein